jgi:hypothetical protein
MREVEEAEARLPKFLRQQGHAQHAKELSKYLRQYVGFTLAGRRLIFLNAFSASDEDFVSCPAEQRPGCRGPDWRTEGIAVMDGGERVWKVEYDPQSGQFLDLRFNGSV